MTIGTLSFMLISSHGGKATAAQLHDAPTTQHAVLVYTCFMQLTCRDICGDESVVG